MTVSKKTLVAVSMAEFSALEASGSLDASVDYLIDDIDVAFNGGSDISVTDFHAPSPSRLKLRKKRKLFRA